MTDPIRLVFIEEQNLVGLGNGRRLANVTYVGSLIREDQVRRRGTFFSAPPIPPCHSSQPAEPDYTERPPHPAGPPQTHWPPPRQPGNPCSESAPHWAIPHLA